MKKKLIMACFLLASASTFAQNEVGSFSIQPKVGINIATMTSLDGTDPRDGFVGGAELEYQATPIFSVTAGALYSQQGIKFENFEFKLDNWGEVDNYAIIEKNTYVFLECERGQKHPNTNVLKLYPYLEENPQISITLIHFFFKENKTPKNRIRLCNFVANKMKIDFGNRFNYKIITQND